jgi:hypothetical protein
LKLVENAHGKALREIDADYTARKRFSSMKQEKDLTKEKLKEKMEFLKQEEKIQENKHKEIIDMEEK